MLNIKKQLSRLYLSSVIDNLSLTGAWVAILAARGYTLVEIGFAETVFHAASLLFEIPSGILADVFGRKNMLIVSTIMKIIGNLIMILSCNFFMICASMVFQALSYNFSSGSGDALAYDSLKIVGNESYFEKYESNQIILYRICSGLSTLCAGLAFLIGYKLAYGTDILLNILQIRILFSLKDIYYRQQNQYDEINRRRSFGKELISCFTTSISFLKKEKRAFLLMLGNSAVGAVDVLLLFFLQAKLLEVGMHQLTIGAALFVMQLGGILGQKSYSDGKKCDTEMYLLLQHSWF